MKHGVWNALIGVALVEKGVSVLSRGVVTNEQSYGLV